MVQAAPEMTRSAEPEHTGRYNPEEKKRNLADTNYEIRFEGITDTLIVPYQVQIDGEMYKVTEVNLEVERRKRQI